MPTLVIQQGHCFRTTGATGTAGEQQYATRVANACAALINGHGGWQVRRILADAPVSQYAGDAFFAIHCDGSNSAAARGASIGYITPEGQAAGQAWKRAYAARGWPGFRPDNYTPALQGYYGTRTAAAQGNRRAVILETGFRTNAEDRALLDGPNGPERVALSIADALGIPVASPSSPEEDVDLADPMRAFIWPHTPEVVDTVGSTLANTQSYSRNTNDIVQQVRTEVLAIRSAVAGLSDDETKFLAAIQGAKGEVLTALAGVLTAIESVDGSPSDEQVAQLGDQISALLPPAIANQLGQRLITPVES